MVNECTEFQINKGKVDSLTNRIEDGLRKEI
jgi:hypothetical protein